MATTAEIYFPRVLKAAKEMGLTDFHAMIIYSQGLQESGFNSRVFNNNNNAFGMKFPRLRKSPYVQGKGTAAPQGESYAGDPYNFYAKYASVEDSVKDLIHRQNYFNINWNEIKTAEDYVDFCRRTKYFQGNPQIYKSNVASLLKRFGDVITSNPGASALTTVVIFFLIYAAVKL